MLDGNEVWTYTFNYTIKSTDPNPLINTAIVTGLDTDGENVQAGAWFSSALSGFDPMLFVDKDGPTIADRGDTVVFTYTVVNLNLVSMAIFDLDDINIAAPGDGSPMNNVTVTDNIAGFPVYISGDYNGNSQLDRSEAWIYTASYTVQDSDPNPLNSMVVAQAEDPESDTISASDTHQLNINIPPIFLPLILK